MYLDSQIDVYMRIQNLTASEYKQFDFLGTYNTLFKIGKRKREFVCRGGEVKLRLIVLRTCTCGVISRLYREKLDVAERGEGGPGGEGPGVRSGGGGLQSRGGAPFGRFRGLSLPLVAIR